MHVLSRYLPSKQLTQYRSTSPRNPHPLTINHKLWAINQHPDTAGLPAGARPGSERQGPCRAPRLRVPFGHFFHLESKCQDPPRKRAFFGTHLNRENKAGPKIIQSLTLALTQQSSTARGASWSCFCHLESSEEKSSADLFSNPSEPRSNRENKAGPKQTCQACQACHGHARGSVLPCWQLGSSSVRKKNTLEGGGHRQGKVPGLGERGPRSSPGCRCRGRAGVHCPSIRPKLVRLA